MNNDMNLDSASPAPGKSVRKGVAIGLTAGLLGGAAAGFAFGVPGLTSAASPSVVQQTEDTVPADPATDPADADTVDADTVDAGTRLPEVLQPLVDDGTITAEQADAVTAHLKESLPERGGGHGHGGGLGHAGGGLGRFLGESSDAVTELLGIDAETLREELRDGATLAEVATAHGVDTQTLIDTLVATATAHIDEAVTDGRIDAAEAEERKATLVERVTDRVNGVRPERPAADDTPVTTED